MKKFLDAHVANGFGRMVIAIVGLLLAVLLMRFLHKRQIFLRV